jgi:DNA-binding NarL/FixJ family response regulator
VGVVIDASSIPDAESVERPRVLLADEHPAMLALMADALAGECLVIGKVTDGSELLAEAERLDRDVVVLDITMPRIDGIEAARQLRRSHRPARLVFLTVHEDADYARAALDAGGLGYVVKSRLASDFLPAIRAALANRTFISPTRRLDEARLTSPSPSETNANIRKTMNQIVTPFRILGAFALLALAVGCASVQSKENSLVAAGFHLVVPKTAAQQQKLKSLPPDKVSMVQKSGKTYYVFPDAAHNQAYVGGPKQYQAYRQLRMKQKLANEKLEAAEMNVEASQMDWGGLGGWGGWGPGWY